MIFEISKQQVFRFTQENREIANIAVSDLIENAGPDLGVEAFVFSDLFREALDCLPVPHNAQPRII